MAALEAGSATVTRPDAPRSDHALPIAPSMDVAVASVEAPGEEEGLDRRVLWIAGLAILIGIAGGLIAELLTHLIGLITNLAYFGRLATEFVAPAAADPGAWSILVPVAGALVIGIMARFGSAAIRGHGIPEVMEKVLHGESRIPVRVMFLKPLSAAIAIGTGGPFGAEGPIIATGGALGSVVGQALRITSDERKVLLAAGAAAGMAATFGSPVSAVLLAVELLLFEYRARSIIPVALAAAAATAVRLATVGGAPVFAVPALAQPGAVALAVYVVLGALIGFIAVLISRSIYAIEDAFERLPIHWMWWPALGAVVVGVIGVVEPDTLGVGYYNIDRILSGELLGTALLTLVVLKYLSWSVYLGSGTSGGTLAPLFTIGGGIGAALGSFAAAALPAAQISVPIAGLVGMAAIFAGASHALLASVVFAFETTREPLGLLPLLGGCSAAYLVALLLSRHSIMTERLARRGALARPEYAIDFLSLVPARDAMTRAVATLRAEQTLTEVRAWLASKAGAASHQGFPVLAGDGRIVGVVTRRDLLDEDAPADASVAQVVRRTPVVVYESQSLRQAADQMVRHGIGRLPVLSEDQPARLVGILSRSDLLAAHQRRLHAATEIPAQSLAGRVRSRFSSSGAEQPDAERFR